jgi:hypothetical protein
MSCKLSEMEESDEKNRMMETIESKIMSLQSKLRAVKEKRQALENGDPITASSSSAPEAVRAVSQGSDHSASGGRRPGGRVPGRGRWAPGGRGFGSGRTGRGNISLDFRPKAVIVHHVPEAFSSAAKQHFSRFSPFCQCYTNLSYNDFGCISFVDLVPL